MIFFPKNRNKSTWDNIWFTKFYSCIDNLTTFDGSFGYGHIYTYNKIGFLNSLYIKMDENVDLQKNAQTGYQTYLSAIDKPWL